MAHITDANINCKSYVSDVHRRYNVHGLFSLIIVKYTHSCAMGFWGFAVNGMARREWRDAKERSNGVFFFHQINVLCSRWYPISLVRRRKKDRAKRKPYCIENWISVPWLISPAISIQIEYIIQSILFENYYRYYVHCSLFTFQSNPHKSGISIQ